MKVVCRAKVLAIDATKKEHMHFLGLVGYYRSFCKNFSTVIAPLTDLLKRKVEFFCSNDCQLAFDQIPSILCTVLVLSAPWLDQPFH